MVWCRQQAFAWVNVDQVLSRYKASQGHKEKTQSKGYWTSVNWLRPSDAYTRR